VTDTQNSGTVASEAGACTSVGVALLAAAMALPLASTQAHADSAPERGLIGFKYLDYLDSQPGSSRIRVHSPALVLMTPLSSDWSVSGTLTSDVISGASPAYHTEALTRMHDHRRAVEAEATRYFPNGTLTVGGSISNESDYLSRGVSLQATRSDESKNTTWSAGIGFSNDLINPTNNIVSDETKHVTDVLLGVTQVMTAKDIVQLNLGLSWGRGYFSDPYKVFDNRPRTHDHVTLMGRWNHYLDATQGTARWSYRYYSDNWGIRAHTLGLEYVQPLAQGWTVTPLARVHMQSAANFYVNADPSTYPFPPNPPADAVYYSEDQRMSSFGALTVGVKVVKQLDANWVADVKLEHYGQRGNWQLFGAGSTGLAPFSARTIQLGLSRQF
jgi:hypothetical protein